jgi:uncharacterized membrane protein YbhN (UPF0104 family)
VSGLGHPRLTGLLIAAGVAVGLYLVLPALAGLDETWRLLARGDARWLGLALVLELGSYAGYVVLFNGVFASRAHGIGLRRSCEITLAGVAATRLFAAAGAGGVALTAWALRRSGMSRAAVVSGMTTFLAALYAVYMAALVVAGLGLHAGVLPGPAPFALTVVPAVFGATVIAAALVAARVPGDLAERIARHSPGRRRGVQLAAHGMAGVARGVRGAITLVRARDPSLVGALAWWGFDVAVLWACFRAFGSAPPVAVIVLVYFVGMLANTLPLPGGVGAVDGGMIGAAIGFGIDGGLAIVAVLAYRAIAFWLPTLPGAIAYLRLRRSSAMVSRAEGDHVEVGHHALGRLARRARHEQVRDGDIRQRLHRLVCGRPRLDIGRRLGHRSARLDEPEVVVDPLQHAARGDPSERPAGGAAEDEDGVDAVAHHRALGLTQ